jgi:hypothetical protein
MQLATSTREAFTTCSNQAQITARISPERLSLSAEEGRREDRKERGSELDSKASELDSKVS